jgi:hypothetical protein
MTPPFKLEVVTSCPDCGASLERQVHSARAGYYIGRWCDTHGPYSRESDYYPTMHAALKALRPRGVYTRRAR